MDGDQSSDSTKIAPVMEIAIYRIVQEALTNIRKHSLATEAHVRLSLTPSQIRLTINDNGIGFNAPESVAELANSGNFGLIGLQERALLFGGQLTIDSTPGEGTTLDITMPREVQPMWTPYLAGISRDKR